MKKRPVYLPEDLYHQLAQRATQEGTSIEELVRFALAQTYPSPATLGAQQPAPGLPKDSTPHPSTPFPSRPVRQRSEGKRARGLGKSTPLRPAVPPQPAAPRTPVPDELYVRHQTVDEALYRL
ncbi:MAG: hypothetical protein HY532_05585, partial [Chloroflexi bacterium]|nr:hypothetical protein [Chloroflexota bacterium]